MRSLIIIYCSILFFGCNSSISQNMKLTDLESNQIKASYVDLYDNKVDLSELASRMAQELLQQVFGGDVATNSREC